MAQGRAPSSAGYFTDVQNSVSPSEVACDLWWLQNLKIHYTHKQGNIFPDEKAIANFLYSNDIACN